MLVMYTRNCRMLCRIVEFMKFLKRFSSWNQRTDRYATQCKKKQCDDAVANATLHEQATIRSRGTIIISGSGMEMFYSCNRHAHLCDYSQRLVEDTAVMDSIGCCASRSFPALVLLVSHRLHSAALVWFIHQFFSYLPPTTLFRVFPNSYFTISSILPRWTLLWCMGKADELSEFINHWNAVTDGFLKKANIFCIRLFC